MPLHRLAVLFVAAIACANPTPVLIRAHNAEGAPLPGLEIVAVPFNPDALLDSLAAAASIPRPVFAELESRLRNYLASGKDSSDTAPTQPIESTATRDSVLRLSAALRRMDRTAPGYRDAYARFRELYARYSAREAARENALRRQRTGGRTLAEQATHAADSLRRWERVAYRDFPRLARERAETAGHEARRVTTDSGGRVTLDLPSGRWWLNARLADPANPFLEYHWNVVLTTAGLPFGVPLSTLSRKSRWRH